MSNKTSNPPDISQDLPQADDGFHEPTAAVKRRNIITGLVILAFVIAWILFGLRKVLF